MRTFTFSGGKIKRGLQFSDSDVGEGVVLGLGDRRRPVALDDVAPADVKAGMIYEARPRGIKINGKLKFHVLQKPNRGSYDILLRINTIPVDGENSSSGGWKFYQGHTEVIQQCGYVKDGTEFPDDLVRLNVGDSVIVNPDSKIRYKLSNDRGTLTIDTKNEEATINSFDGIPDINNIEIVG